MTASPLTSPALSLSLSLSLSLTCTFRPHTLMNGCYSRNERGWSNRTLLNLQWRERPCFLTLLRMALKCASNASAPSGETGERRHDLICPVIKLSHQLNGRTVSLSLSLSFSGLLPALKRALQDVWKKSWGRLGVNVHCHGKYPWCNTEIPVCANSKECVWSASA